MGALAAKITAFVVGARPVIIALVAAALLINGGALIYPSERGKERAKDVHRKGGSNRLSYFYKK